MFDIKDTEELFSEDEPPPSQEICHKQSSISSPSGSFSNSRYDSSVSWIRMAKDFSTRYSIFSHSFIHSFKCSGWGYLSLAYLANGVSHKK